MGSQTTGEKHGMEFKLLPPGSPLAGYNKPHPTIISTLPKKKNDVLDLTIKMNYMSCLVLPLAISLFQ